MARSPLTTIEDVSNMNDEQLGKFMEKHRQPNGTIELPLTGWDILSKSERDRLAERLRSTNTSFASTSRPLDLEKLDALLRCVTSKEDSAPDDRSDYERDRRTQTPEDPRERYKRGESDAYSNLVNDGGHPLYPLDLLESISEDPDAFKEMLLPFWRRPRHKTPSEMDGFDMTKVIRRQWHRWQNFRKWQLCNRGLSDDQNDEEDFLAHVEETKRNFTQVGWGDFAARIEADPDSLKRPGESWYYIQRHRDWQRRYQRELGCESFLDYEKALKARLTRHGFARAFQLAEDPKQQDKLTTWIEYLGFEYWWLDRYHESLRRLKPKRDKDWEELKSKGVVKSDETPEFMRTRASAIRHDREEDHARQAVRDAESEAKNVYQKTQKDPDRLSIPKEQRVQMLTEASEGLSKAQATLDFTKRRSDLIIDFVRRNFDYDNAVEDVDNQTNLVTWVAAEAHAIEAEQKSASLKSSSEMKRKASADDVGAVHSGQKRQKSTAKGHSPQSSEDKTGARERRALRRRNQTSIEATQTTERAPSTEAEGKAKSRASKGSARKRKNVVFEDDSPVQLTQKRLKSDSQSYGTQASNSRVETADRRALGPRNRATIDSSHRPNPNQTQDIQGANSRSHPSVPNVTPQESPKGLRRSSRLAAVRSRSGTSGSKNQVVGDLGSEYSQVEKLLGKRTRRRGRGRSLEYLVKFKDYDGSHASIKWVSARQLPKLPWMNLIDLLMNEIAGEAVEVYT